MRKTKSGKEAHETNWQRGDSARGVFSDITGGG